MIDTDTKRCVNCNRLQLEFMDNNCCSNPEYKSFKELVREIKRLLQIEEDLKSCIKSLRQGNEDMMQILDNLFERTDE